MNREKLLDQLKRISTDGKGTKELYGEISRVCMDEIKRDWSKKSVKNAYYLSVEFLMGRMFFNNLMELGVLN